MNLPSRKVLYSVGQDDDPVTEENKDEDPHTRGNKYVQHDVDPCVPLLSSFPAARRKKSCHTGNSKTLINMSTRLLLLQLRASLPAAAETTTSVTASTTRMGAPALRGPAAATDLRRTGSLPATIDIPIPAEAAGEWVGVVPTRQPRRGRNNRCGKSATDDEECRLVCSAETVARPYRTAVVLRITVSSTLLFAEADGLDARQRLHASRRDAHTCLGGNSVGNLRVVFLCGGCSLV